MFSAPLPHYGEKNIGALRKGTANFCPVESHLSRPYTCGRGFSQLTLGFSFWPLICKMRKERYINRTPEFSITYIPSLWNPQVKLMICSQEHPSVVKLDDEQTGKWVQVQILTRVHRAKPYGVSGGTGQHAFPRMISRYNYFFHFFILVMLKIPCTVLIFITMVTITKE